MVQAGLEFNEPVTITLKYDDSGIDETTIDIYFYNTTTELWVAQGATCDTVLNECSLTVNHFSEFYSKRSWADTDGDGIADIEDICPVEDATGFDADGCIDTLSGLQYIIDTLDPLVLSDNVKTSLVAKISAAEKQATKDNICTGVNILGAFKSQIEAQRGKKMSSEAADLLTDYAINIISKLVSQLPEGEIC